MNKSIFDELEIFLFISKIVNNDLFINFKRRLNEKIEINKLNNYIDFITHNALKQDNFFLSEKEIDLAFDKEVEPLPFKKDNYLRKIVPIREKKEVIILNSRKVLKPLFSKEFDLEEKNLEIIDLKENSSISEKEKISFRKKGLKIKRSSVFKKKYSQHLQNTEDIVKKKVKKKKVQLQILYKKIDFKLDKNVKRVKINKNKKRIVNKKTLDVVETTYANFNKTYLNPIAKYENFSTNINNNILNKTNNNLNIKENIIVKNSKFNAPKTHSNGKQIRISNTNQYKEFLKTNKNVNRVKNKKNNKIKQNLNDSVFFNILNNNFKIQKNFSETNRFKLYKFLNKN